MPYRFAALVALIGCGSVRADAPEALAGRALTVLREHCHRCHGRDGAVEGGFNYSLDLGKLVARKKVVPGRPDESRLFARVADGSMPPEGEGARPSADDREALRAWIAAGATANKAAAAEAQPYTNADAAAWALADAGRFDRRARRFLRYFSLVPQGNVGQSDDELRTLRNATSKLINSLSWHPEVRPPEPVGPRGLLLRIDLRWYLWDAGTWNKLLADYPYALADDSAAGRALAVTAAARMPIARADWFVATASRPPLYYDLLQIPSNLSELERQLRVDSELDLRQERVTRAGFNGSGVSRNNRLLERHDSAHGVYWRTYDFDAVPASVLDRGTLAALPDRRNLFAYPLGPGAGELAFQHAGGEAIFSLPNGLHGYVLVNANNVRVDKGPQAVVSDPRRPDRSVEAGVSCMSCHTRGVIPKADQVREHTARNSSVFGRADADLIRALYPPAERTLAVMEADARKYCAALERAGATAGRTEVVSTATLRYEADLDATTAAAEVGVTPAALREAIDGGADLARNLGALRAEGGSVARQVFVQAFADAARRLRLGAPLAPGFLGAGLADGTGELEPLEALGGAANAAAFSSDGRLTLLASGDRSARLWDASLNRETRRFIGHTASAWSAALSADGRRALTGSADGTARLWDATTGEELRKLDGHLGLVSAVALSGDGRRALTGSFDQSVSLWDLGTGREMKRVEVSGYPQTVALLPGGRALVADGALRLLDMSEGKVLRTLTEGPGVAALAISIDGKLALTGGDGPARLWEIDSGREVRSFAGHTGAVRATAISADGRRAATAGSDGSVRLWRLDDGKQLGVFGKHVGPVVAVAFAGDKTVSADRDGNVLAWNIAKFQDDEPVAPAGAGSSQVAPVTAVLRPTAVIPLDATAGSIFIADTGKSLLVHERAGGRVVKIDTKSLRVTRTLDLPAPAEALALAPGGDWLYAAVARKGGGSLLSIDPAALEVRRSLDLPAAPYDLAAANGGGIYVSGAGVGWSEVAAVDARVGKVLNRWGGVWGGSVLRLSADGVRLYASTSGVSPGKVDALTLPARPDERPVVAPSPPGAAGLGGEFSLSPDGRLLVAASGVVLRLSPSRDDDMQPLGVLEPHLAANFDVGRGLVVLLTPGGWLKAYHLDDLRPAGAARLPVPAYRLALDAAGGKLYVVVADVSALRERPRLRGLGDIHVYEWPGPFGK